MKVLTRMGSWIRCGSSDPGIAARARISSRMSAARMVVSCRQAQRSIPTKPMLAGAALAARAGLLEGAGFRPSC